MSECSVEVEYVFNWRLRRHGSGEQTVSADKMTFREAMAMDRFAVLIPESGQKRIRDDVPDTQRTGDQKTRLPR
jgi:hypothetical protein